MLFDTLDQVVSVQLALLPFAAVSIHGSMEAEERSAIAGLPPGAGCEVAAKSL